MRHIGVFVFVTAVITGGLSLAVVYVASDSLAWIAITVCCVVLGALCFDAEREKR